MNGSPDRLDLAVERARRAVAGGCLVSIDSDAHAIRELDFVRWGVSQARRAWVEPEVGGQHLAAGPAAGVGRGQAGARGGGGVRMSERMAGTVGAGHGGRPGGGLRGRRPHERR